MDVIYFLWNIFKKKKHLFMSWNRAENGGPKFRPRKSVQEGKFVKNSVDCSQSAIFSWDRLDIPRLTVTAILFFKCTEGAGVGNYSSGAGGIGGGGGEKNRGTVISIFLASSQTTPAP